MKSEAKLRSSTSSFEQLDQVPIFIKSKNTQASKARAKLQSAVPRSNIRRNESVQQLGVDSNKYILHSSQQPLTPTVLNRGSVQDQQALKQHTSPTRPSILKANNYTRSFEHALSYNKNARSNFDGGAFVKAKENNFSRRIAEQASQNKPSIFPENPPEADRLEPGRSSMVLASSISRSQHQFNIFIED